MLKTPKQTKKAKKSHKNRRIRESQNWKNSQNIMKNKKLEKSQKGQKNRKIRKSQNWKNSQNLIKNKKLEKRQKRQISQKSQKSQKCKDPKIDEKANRSKKPKQLRKPKRSNQPNFSKLSRVPETQKMPKMPNMSNEPKILRLPKLPKLPGLPRLSSLLSSPRLPTNASTSLSKSCISSHHTFNFTNFFQVRPSRYIVINQKKFNSRNSDPAHFMFFCYDWMKTTNTFQCWWDHFYNPFHWNYSRHFAIVWNKNRNNLSSILFSWTSRALFMVCSLQSLGTPLQKTVIWSRLTSVTGVIYNLSLNSFERVIFTRHSSTFLNTF